MKCMMQFTHNLLCGPFKTQTIGKKKVTDGSAGKGHKHLESDTLTLFNRVFSLSTFYKAFLLKFMSLKILTSIPNIKYVMLNPVMLSTVIRETF